MGNWLNKQGLANIEIDAPFAQLAQRTPGMTADDAGTIVGGDYEVACYQPAIVALDRNSKALFTWSSVARANNIGGAANRPSADETWKAVTTSLSGDFSLVNFVSPRTYAAPMLPPPLFYLILIGELSE